MSPETIPSSNSVGQWEEKSSLRPTMERSSKLNQKQIYRTRGLRAQLRLRRAVTEETKRRTRLKIRLLHKLQWGAIRWTTRTPRMPRVRRTQWLKEKIPRICRKSCKAGNPTICAWLVSNVTMQLRKSTDRGAIIRVVFFKCIPKRPPRVIRRCHMSLSVCCKWRSVPCWIQWCVNSFLS